MSARREGGDGVKKLLMAVWVALMMAPFAWANHTATDETGHAVSVPEHAHRIICLIPSVTDAVFALGAGDDVVAVSDYVKFPAEAMKKPSVGSIMAPSLETILDFHPDLVLGSPNGNPQGMLDEIRKLGIPVYLVDPHGVSGILRSIRSLGEATNREAQAAALVARLTQRIAAVKARVAGKPVVSIYMPVSYEPNMTIGKGAFITELIELAGGHSITSDLPREWPTISMETVVERAPQALLLYRGGKVSVEMLASRPGWDVLPAVKNKRVYYVDNRINFPSPIAIDALEDLAKEFHP